REILSREICIAAGDQSDGDQRRESSVPGLSSDQRCARIMARLGSHREALAPYGRRTNFLDEEAFSYVDQGTPWIRVDVVKPSDAVNILIRVAIALANRIKNENG